MRSRFHFVCQVSGVALAFAVLYSAGPVLGQAITLEDDLNSNPEPPAVVEPASPEPPPQPATATPDEPVQPRADVNLELVPPETSPEEPFITDGGSQPDLVQESENEMLFGPEPAEDIVSESDRVSTEPERKWFFGEWLGNLLAVGSSGDPDSKDRFRLSLSLSAGYDSNVLASSVDQIASAFATLSGGVAYFIGSQRFEFSLQAAGGVTQYQERPGGRIDYNGQLSMGGFYRFDRRLTFNAMVNLAYLSQPDPEVIGGVSSFQGDYTTSDISFNFAYLLTPTVTLRPAYRLTAIRYQDEQVNQASGFYSQTFSLALEWLARPATTLISEYRYNPVTYNLEGEGSEGHILTAGFTQSFSRKLEWDFQAGAEYRLIQNPFENSTTKYLGPFVESALTYQFAPASELTGRLRYGTEPSGTGGVTIRQTLRTTLGVAHSFSGRVSLDVGVGYENSFYDQPDVLVDYSQVYYFAYANARYRISNSLALTLGYSYTSVDVSFGNGDYTRGVTTAGFEFSF